MKVLCGSSSSFCRNSENGVDLLVCPVEGKITAKDNGATNRGGQIENLKTVKKENESSEMKSDGVSESNGMESNGMRISTEQKCKQRSDFG